MTETNPPAVPLTLAERIAQQIDWTPTCLPGTERATIVRQILDLSGVRDREQSAEHPVTRMERGIRTALFGTDAEVAAARAEPSGDTGRPTAEPSDAWVIGRFADATAQHGDRTFEMWDDDVHRTSAAALHHHVMHVEDPDPWSWHIYALVRIAYAGSSGDTVQAPDVTELRAALQRVADVLDFADGAIDPPITTEIDTNIVRMALLDTEDAPPAELRRQVRALLGADTTPEADRG